MLGNKDAASLECAADTLKGSVGRLCGAELASTAALRLELIGRNSQFDDAEDAYRALGGRQQQLDAALTLSAPASGFLLSPA